MWTTQYFCNMFKLTTAAWIIILFIISRYVWVPQFFLFVFLQHLFSLFISGETVCKLFFLSPSTTFIWSVTNATRRSVEHCTPHADGAWLNELGWSQ